MTSRRKVFISFYHADDEPWRDQFLADFSHVFINKSVNIGGIDGNLPDETIRRKIRDEYLRDSTVTVVLVGENTWRRKHVDWEIASTLHNGQRNKRGALLGILLPTRDDSQMFNSDSRLYHQTIPKRLWLNAESRYAPLRGWPPNARALQQWLEVALRRRAELNAKIGGALRRRNASTSALGWS